jgi:hypothetical protein
MKHGNTIKVSAEVQALMLAVREVESDSPHRIILGLLAHYDATTVKVRLTEKGFVLVIADDVIPIPEFSALTYSVNLSVATIEKLRAIKSHPDESHNFTVWKLIQFAHTKPDLRMQMQHEAVKALGRFGGTLAYANPEELMEMQKIYLKLANRYRQNGGEAVPATIAALEQIEKQVWERESDTKHLFAKNYDRDFREYFEDLR